MTLEQIRKFHVAYHTGFIWQCSYCRDAWAKAKEYEERKEKQL